MMITEQKYGEMKMASLSLFPLLAEFFWCLEKVVTGSYIIQQFRKIRNNLNEEHVVINKIFV